VVNAQLGGTIGSLGSSATALISQLESGLTSLLNGVNIPTLFTNVDSLVTSIPVSALSQISSSASTVITDIENILNAVGASASGSGSGSISIGGLLGGILGGLGGSGSVSGSVSLASLLSTFETDLNSLFSELDVNVLSLPSLIDILPISSLTSLLTAVQNIKTAATGLITAAEGTL